MTSSADRWSRSRRRWGLGLITGVVAGSGALLTGAFGAVLAIVAVLLLAARPPREAPVGGLTVGMGSAWLALLIRSDLACDLDCVGPDLRPWYAIATGFIGVGVIVTARALRR